jgi:DHA1 family bicyclomycin/chloramphenicol resistance-like MFS transporter
MASSVEQLWAFRFFQAIGGGFAVVNTNAIVRDLFSGKEAAKVFSVISMIMMIAPMAAPVIGISILSFFTWKYIFYFLCIYAVLLSYFIAKLPETSPKSQLTDLFASYISIFKNYKTMILVFANGFGFSGLFIFITKSSFIYMEYFNQTQFFFALFFSLNVVSLMLFSKINIMLLDSYEPYILFKRGMIMQLSVAVLLSITASFINVYFVVLGFMLYIGTLGFVFANGIALILENYKNISATATAVNGVSGFIIASLVGFLASYFHNGSLEPIFYLMGCTSLLSLVLLALYKKI